MTTKITTDVIADGALSADSTGRAKMADGFITAAKLGSGAVDNAAVAAGAVVQVVNTQTGAVATGTTVLPYDDTIPQNTEGVEFMTLAITPKSATNKLKIDVVIEMANSASANLMTAALFQDSTANALAACTSAQQANVNQPQTLKFAHFMTAGTTSSTTFKVRAGGDSAGTTTFNGSGTARKFGGVLASSITITEIKV